MYNPIIRQVICKLVLTDFGSGCLLNLLRAYSLEHVFWDVLEVDSHDYDCMELLQYVVSFVENQIVFNFGVSGQGVDFLVEIFYGFSEEVVDWSKRTSFLQANKNSNDSMENEFLSWGGFFDLLSRVFA